MLSILTILFTISSNNCAICLRLIFHIALIITWTANQLQNRCKIGAKRMQNPKFLSGNERTLLEFLRNGPRQYSEIVAHLGTNKIAQRTANDLLNEMVDTRKLFRVERRGKTFYRLNDFPDELKVKLALIDTWQRAQPEIKPLVDTLITNLALFYPKVKYEGIVKLTFVELSAQYQNDVITTDFINRIKEVL